MGCVSQAKSKPANTSATTNYTQSRPTNTSNSKSIY